MSKPTRQEIRTARRRRLAEILAEGFCTGKTELTLKEIQPEFTGISRFIRDSSLHAFVNYQHLLAPHPGKGGHHKRVILLEGLARRYSNEILGIEKVEDIPDFEPIGDLLSSSHPEPRI